MTVNTTDRIVSYTGNGVTVAFAVTFQFYSIDVYVDGEVVAGADYTVTGGSGSTGTVTFDTAPVNGAEVVILSVQGIEQTVNYRDFDDAPADLYEASLDKIIMAIRDLNERVDRTVRSSRLDPSFGNLDFEGNPGKLVAVSSAGVPELATATEFNVTGGSLFFQGLIDDESSRDWPLTGFSSLATTTEFDSDPINSGYFSEFEGFAAHRMRLTQSEVQAADESGGWRSALVLHHFDHDTTDYESAPYSPDYRTISDALRVGTFGPQTAGAYSVQYKDLHGITAAAVGNIASVERGTAGIAVDSINFNTGVLLNELAVYNPAGSTQSGHIAGFLINLIGKVASADASHFVRGIEVLNSGKLATTAFEAIGTGTGGDPGTFKSLLKGDNASVEDAAIIMPASVAGDVGTYIFYETGSYSWYSRSGNSFQWAIGGANMLALDAGMLFAPNGLDLGSGAFPWSNFYLGASGFLDFGNNDVRLTHSANTLALTGGSLRLGAASSETGSLVLANASSAFLTTIQAGNAAAARTYIWPTNFGAAGTVLTDAAGDGTLSWAAPSASSVTAANEATDTTCFILFATDATGAIGVKTNANLTFNSLTGVLSTIASGLKVGSGFVREVLAANRTYYVRTDGSDSNTGLVDNAGGAFLTLQKAWDVVQETLDLNGYDVTIDIQGAPYAAGVTANGPVTGPGTVTFLGDAVTPTNVLISTTSANCFAANYGAVFRVRGVEMRTTTSGNCLQSAFGGTILFDTVVFGACAGSHAEAFLNGVIRGDGNYTISGAALAHLHAYSEGLVSLASLTATVSGTPAFTNYFAGCAAAHIICASVVWSGGATGTRFYVHKNGQIDTGGGGLTYFPGNAAGTIVAGGVYDTTEEYTAADVLAKLLTVDGAGSGLDADLLDGNSSAFYATATGLSDHLADATAAHAASAISFSPHGTIVATDVQAAIQEVRDEAQPLDADLTAIAALTTTAYGRSLLELADETALEALLDTLPNLTSIQGRTVTLADAGANAFFGWDDTAGAYENLTAAEALAIILTVDGAGSGLDADLLDGKSTGTSGNTIPLLDGANTWSGAQTFAAAVVFNEAGADVDLRMEGDTEANLFFLDASADCIGIGVAAPSFRLDVGGNIRASTSADTYVVVNAGATFESAITFPLANSNRWTVGRNNTAESGSNAGSDFIIRAYTDAGAVLGTYLTITRSTGAVALTGSLTLPNTGLIVGASTPFSDAAGTLTLQNVDALDATTEATIEAAIDTLANLTSIQGRTVTLADAGANAFLGWDDAAGAYENLTAAEALAIIMTVDGSGSGLDADLLDGKNTGTSGNTVPLLDGANTWSGAQTFNAAFVFNETGADIDLRMEGDTNANLFFLDASTDRIGIGTNGPICLFHVAAGSLTPATELGGLTVTGSTTAMRLALGVNNDSTMYSFINSVENGVSHRSLLLQTLGGNVKIGSSNALRNTTDGSGQLVLFDSTAPSGTLTNGVSFYSASGEARVMDAAGNSTLLSPHDPVTNEWIYHSFDTRTGKGLRIDMERMVRFLNDKYKLDFVHEFAA
jgi:hypothetical protein